MEGKLDFYRDLPVFSDFSELGQPEKYYKAPQDWYVIITDVKNTTNAIFEGRYKDVNTIGAATIASIKNGMDGEDFPYSFGGDGASIIVPPEHIEQIKDELCALRGISKDKFGLELRVGVVPIAEICKNGVQIEVAKYELTAGNCMAMFKGQGLHQAEKWVKSTDTYELEERTNTKTDLKQLSCRWKPIKSRNGQMLCLLFQAKDKQDLSTYASFLQDFGKIIPEDSDHAPVNYKKMEYKEPLKNVRDETRYGYGNWFSWSRGVVVYLQTLLFIMPWFRNRVFSQYLHDMNLNTDYKKFDDMLRMVVDCTPAQIKNIKALCEKYHQEHKAYFGIHLSDNALMTCFVEDLFKGKHMHFIDGDNGGYAMAALPLKEQQQAA